MMDECNVVALSSTLFIIINIKRKRETLKQAYNKEWIMEDHG